MVALENCNYISWKANHLQTHKDKIFRELYPFSVLRRIDFSVSQIGKRQDVFVNGCTYSVEIQKNELQENGRWRSTFILTTNIEREEIRWIERSWNERLQIVYSKDLQFITVFTKKEDQYKRLVKAFFSKRFDRIIQNRSRPLSSILFRSLLLHMCEEAFGVGEYDRSFNKSENSPILIEEGESFSPLYSQGDSLWVCYSFQEDKAHRFASNFDVTNGGRVHVVFINPVYTKHKRTNKKGVFIQSLYEFAYQGGQDLFRSCYEQVRFLQNHLNEVPNFDVDTLRAEIERPKPGNYQILKSELMEALAIMKVLPKGKDEVFIYLSCMNLLNAYINRNRKSGKNTRLYRDMYSFKHYLLECLEFISKHPVQGVKLFVELNFVIIEVDDFQFSFHNVPISDVLHMYMSSESNAYISWKGKRLQPIAPLVLRYGRAKYSW